MQRNLCTDCHHPLNGLSKSILPAPEGPQRTSGLYYSLAVFSSGSGLFNKVKDLPPLETFFHQVSEEHIISVPLISASFEYAEVVETFKFPFTRVLSSCFQNP
jgi:hypothetical protein